MEKFAHDESPRGLEAIRHGSSVLSETANLLKLLSEKGPEIEAMKKARYRPEPCG